jgi:DNA (cytosine-5)-methyltransferase 3A
LTTCGGGNTQKKIIQEGRVRKLLPIEYERLQTVPDNYTKGVSNTRRYNMLGNGWTVEVIKFILKNLKEE